MIRYLETIPPEQMEELCSFCASDVYGVRALGPVLSYGTGYDFVSAWEQRDDEGARTAFLSKNYGSVTVCGTGAADREELEVFLRAIGYSALLGPSDLLPGFAAEGEQGPVMELPRGDACVARTVPLSDGISLVADDNFRDFYDVLTESNPGYLTGSYEVFLTDLSHRVRHGTAHTVVLYENGVPAATAAVLSELPTASFLGAIATRPSFRGNRYASTCIRTLCDARPDRRVFLLCRPEKQGFYEHLGFKAVDQYCER